MKTEEQTLTTKISEIREESIKIIAGCTHHVILNYLLILSTGELASIADNILKSKLKK